LAVFFAKLAVAREGVALPLYEFDFNDFDFNLPTTVYNIKNGRNSNIVKYCATLREYGIFTDMIRENRKTMPLKEAIRKAVEDCIKQNVLKSFLLKHREEVMGILLTEWDADGAL